MGPITVQFKQLFSDPQSLNAIENLNSLRTSIDTELNKIDPSTGYAPTKAYVDAADNTFATNASIGIAAFVKRSTITVTDTSMYITATDGSIWSWKVTKV
jgi:hypothetical protein